MFGLYMNAKKTELNLTNQELSNLSGVPKGTVDRLLARDGSSPNLDTAVALIKAVGGSLDEAVGIQQTTVPLPEKAPEDTVGALVLLRDILVRIHLIHNTAANQRDAVSAEYSRFRSRVMFVSLFINACFFALLIYDFTHPEIGWIRYDVAAYMQQGFMGGVAVCSAWWANIRA